MGCRVTALVSDAHAAEEAYTPYQRPPDFVALRTAIPRGLLSFVVRGAELAAKPLNDTLLVSITWTLPANFGYVFNELNVNFQADRAPDFDTIAMLRFHQTSAATKDFDWRYGIDMNLVSENGTSARRRQTDVHAGQITRTPIAPPSGGSTGGFSIVNRNATAQLAGELDFLISFFQFDLEQITWFPAHSTMATATR